MILRHPHTPSQVTPASVSLSHPPWSLTDTGQDAPLADPAAKLRLPGRKI
jgi:hypothetical protein